MVRKQSTRAVSPVISVILLVAVTTVMAATVGVFVLQAGVTGPPEVSISFDYTDNSETLGKNDTLRITYDGGDTVRAANISVMASNVYNQTATGPQPVTTTTGEMFDSTGTVTQGETTTLTADLIGATGPGEVAENGDLLLNQSTVRIVYTGDDEETAVLAKWTGPDS